MRRVISIADVSGFIQAMESAQTPGVVVLWESDELAAAGLKMEFRYVDEKEVRCQLKEQPNRWLTLRILSCTSGSSTSLGGYSLKLQVRQVLGLLREGWTLTLEV